MQSTLSLSAIRPDPDNIRDNADDSDIALLAADISKNGLLQPLVVYETSLRGVYQISGGHRRYHAVLSLGWTDVDVNIIDAPGDDLERLDLMGAENLQRRQLNPIEEAKYYKRYLDAGLNQAEVAQRVGRPQSHVSSIVLLLDFSDDIQRRIASGEVTLTAARQLMKNIRRTAGYARSDMGGSQKRSGFNVPYFTSAHPLHGQAASYCRAQGHDPAIRICGACGPCWERAIRIDARGSSASTDPPPAIQPRERFDDPREILRRLLCTRCGTPAIEREGVRCTTVRDGRRVPFERHEFVIEVAADAAA